MFHHATVICIETPGTLTSPYPLSRPERLLVKGPLHDFWIAQSGNRSGGELDVVGGAGAAIANHHGSNHLASACAAVRLLVM